VLFQSYTIHVYDGQATGTVTYSGSSPGLMAILRTFRAALSLLRMPGCLGCLKPPTP